MEKHQDNRLPADQLSWSEKAPLYFAVAAQSLVVFRWYLGPNVPLEITDALRWLNLVVAVVAGLALDLVVVTTTMGRREGRESIWSWLTAGAAALFSAAVAVELYGGPSLGPWLHISYPAIVFLFAQHLAVKRTQAKGVSTPTSHDARKASAPATHTCARCGASVESQQQAAATVRWGCGACKVKMNGHRKEEVVS